MILEQPNPDYTPTTKQDFDEHLRLVDQWIGYPTVFNKLSLRDIDQQFPTISAGERRARLSEIVNMFLSNTDRVELVASADMSKRMIDNMSVLKSLNVLKKADRFTAPIVVTITPNGNNYIHPGNTRLMFTECRPFERVDVMLTSYQYDDSGHGWDLARNYHLHTYKGIRVILRPFEERRHHRTRYTNPEVWFKEIRTYKEPQHTIQEGEVLTLHLKNDCLYVNDDTVELAERYSDEWYL